MLQTRISITEPNGVKRMIPLTAQGLIIGRSPDNGLVINYPTVSRYHAQVGFDGVNHFVTDLDSDNGTYLGNARLAPQQPAVWPLGTPLHIGGVVFQLEQGQYQSPSEQLHQQQPVSRDRQNTDTITGWQPGVQEPKQRSTGMIWIGLVLALGFLCLCAALGVGGYAYFYGFNF